MNSDQHITRAIKLCLKDAIKPDDFIVFCAKRLPASVVEVLHFYNKIHRLFTNYVDIKDALLPMIWDYFEITITYDDCNMLIFICDSLWRDYIKDTDLQTLLLRYKCFSKNIMLQLLLIKFPHKLELYYDQLCSHALPMTIIKYAKQDIPNKPTLDLSKFHYLIPDIYKKLNITPSRDEINTMIIWFPHLMIDILDLAKDIDIDMLNRYLAGYNKGDTIRDEHYQDIYQDIYKVCHVDKTIKPEGYHVHEEPMTHFGGDVKNTTKNEHITNIIIKKVLSHKIIPNEETFKLVCDINAGDNAIQILINNGFNLEKKHVIYAIGQSVNISQFTDIQFDEDDYFHIFIHEIRLNDKDIKLFEPNIQNQVQLREMFRYHQFSNAYKFMKKYDMKPDRYCMDYSHNVTGNSRGTLIKIIREFNCAPSSSITYLQNLKHSNIFLKASEIDTICKSNNIDAAFMATKY